MFALRLSTARLFPLQSSVSSSSFALRSRSLRLLFGQSSSFSDLFSCRSSSVSPLFAHFSVTRFLFLLTSSPSSSVLREHIRVVSAVKCSIPFSVLICVLLLVYVNKSIVVAAFISASLMNPFGSYLSTFSLI